MQPSCTLNHPLLHCRSELIIAITTAPSRLSRPPSGLCSLLSGTGSAAGAPGTATRRHHTLAGIVPDIAERAAPSPRTLRLKRGSTSSDHAPIICTIPNCRTLC